MPVLSIGTSAEKIIESNKKRKLFTVTNDHDTAKVYISDEPDPSATDAKWILLPKETLIFDGEGDFPERAYYAISDTASTTLIVGYQNEEK